MKTHLYRPEPFYKRKQVIISATAGAVFIGVIIYFVTRNADPANMAPSEIRKFVESEDFNSLSHEQRREFFDKMMDQQVTGYFSTPKADRDKYLDKIIDERKNAPRPTGMRPPGGPDPNRPRDPNMVRQAPTAEDMRARREMRDPIKDSSRREFMGALMRRAQQRGIQMGPPGGGGPGGGGPGGGLGGGGSF